MYVLDTRPEDPDTSHIKFGILPFFGTRRDIEKKMGQKKKREKVENCIFGYNSTNPSKDKILLEKKFIMSRVKSISCLWLSCQKTEKLLSRPIDGD